MRLIDCLFLFFQQFFFSTHNKRFVNTKDSNFSNILGPVNAPKIVGSFCTKVNVLFFTFFTLMLLFRDYKSDLKNLDNSNVLL